MNATAAYIQYLHDTTRAALASGHLGYVSRARYVPYAVDARYGTGFEANAFNLPEVPEMYPDKNLSTFLKMLEGDPTYQDLANALPVPDDSSGHAGLGLSWYVEQVVRRLLRGTSSLERDVEALEADLKLRPHAGHTDVWVTGMYLPQDRVTLEGGLILRRFISDDVPLDPRYAHGPGPGMVTGYPSAVLVIPGSLGGRVADILLVQRALRLLSLVGIGTVMQVAVVSQLNTLDPLTLSRLHDSRPWRTSVRYPFDGAAQRRYTHLVEHLGSGLFSRTQEQLRSVDWTGMVDVDTAFERYDTALDAKSVDVKVARLVEALEALFGENGTEVKRRICQRAALLLGLVGQDAVSTFALLGKCYDHRSTHAHGGRLTGKALTNATAAVPHLTSHVHQLMVLTVLIRQGIPGRTEFLALLDGAMLDHEQRERLTATVLSVTPPA